MALNAWERHAIGRLVDQATTMGVEVPPEVTALLHEHGETLWPAREWARLHPDDSTGCCWGEVLGGQERCSCWTPVYAAEQAAPRPPADPADIGVMDAQCGDCAFRRDSPERSGPVGVISEPALLELPVTGAPFWCHHGMRRPAYWIHPDGRRVDGSPHDWHPPAVNGIPYQTDGAPGLLCHGWVTRAVRHHGTMGAVQGHVARGRIDPDGVGDP